MDALERFRGWQLDRQARRPSGRKAREVYGADDAHDFLWPQVLEALTLTPGDRLLDAGCGGGAFLRHVLATVGCEATGIDHSRDMVRVARAKTSGARILEADVAALPFADGEFTAISSLVALMHFPDGLAALRELRRVVDREQGRVAVLTASPESRGTPASPEAIAARSRFYTDEELVALAREAGFGEARIARREEWSQLLLAQP